MTVTPRAHPRENCVVPSADRLLQHDCSVGRRPAAQPAARHTEAAAARHIEAAARHTEVVERHTEVVACHTEAVVHHTEAVVRHTEAVASHTEDTVAATWLESQECAAANRMSTCGACDPSTHCQE